MIRGKDKHIRAIIPVVYLLFTGITAVCAQDTIPKTINADTLVSVNDSVISLNDSITEDSIAKAFESIFQHDDSASVFFPDQPVIVIMENNKTGFKPNPKFAWKAALMFPGLGQIYNRQYWKLPIVYGGLMGCTYAITWNNKTYQDYKKAYFDIVADAKKDSEAASSGGERPGPESWSQSWQDFVSASDNPASRLNDRTFHERLKRGKDNFRRYRDLSIIVCVGIYMIFVADSYVDAQMFDFDVSPDLSFRVTPEFTPGTLTGYRSYGINVCMTF